MKRFTGAAAPLLCGGILLLLALLSTRGLHGAVCQDVYFDLHRMQARTSGGPWLPLPVVQMCDNRVLPALLITLTIAASAAWAAARIRPAKTALLAAGALMALAASIFFPYVPSTDPYAYAVYGYEAAHGISPYTASGARTSHSAALSQLYRFFPRGSTDRVANYGPVAVLQYHATALAAGDSLARFILLQRACNACLVVLLAWLLALVRPPGTSRREAAWIAFHPLVLLESIAFGHGDVLMLVLLCAALLAYRAGARGICAALIVLACETRLVAGLAMAVLVVELSRRDVRAFVRPVCAAIVTLAETGVGAALAYGKFSLGSAPAIEAFSSPAMLAFDAFGVTMKHASAGMTTQAALGLTLIAAALLVKRYQYLPFGALAALPIVRAWYCQWLVPLVALSGDRSVRVAAGISASIAIVAEYPAMTAHSDLRTWCVILVLQWAAPIAVLALSGLRLRRNLSGTRALHAAGAET